MADLPPMALQNFGCPELQGSNPEIPATFTSLEEAYDFYQYYTNQSLHLWYDIKQRPAPERVTEPRIFLDIFRKWQISMQSFLQRNNGTLDPSAQQAARILQLNLQMLELSIDNFTQEHGPRLPVWDQGAFQYQMTGPLAWDRSTAELKHILILARDVVEYSLKIETSQRFRSFALDTNIVETLFAIAHLSRDPFIRREAVALLRLSPRQEGLWDGVVVAQVCEKLIEIEEEGLGVVRSCDDVPKCARVSQLKMNFDEEGRPRKIIYRRSKGPSDLEGVGAKQFFWIGEFARPL